MPYQLLILDCDGVLVDSEPIAHEVLLEMLAEQGLVMDLATAYGHFRGRTMEQCLDTIAELLGKPVGPEFERGIRERTITAFHSKLTAVQGVEAALDQIDVPACVVSNGQREKMRLALGITGLLSRFEGRLVSSVDVGKPKPAPDVLLYAAARFGAATTDCVVVEDSATGVRAAVAAEMTVFGYAALTPARELLEAGANAVFTSMDELPALICPDPEEDEEVEG